MNQQVLEQMNESLEELIKLYRTLLETVRREKDILISSHLDDLNENNRTKEALLVRIRAVDDKREMAAVKLAQEFGVGQSPKLLDLANRVGGDLGDRWRNMHSVLDLLVTRVQELNRQNEILVQAALSNISGAMQSLKDHLKDKSVYQRKGEVGAQVTDTGHLVSREV